MDVSFQTLGKTRYVMVHHYAAYSMFLDYGGVFLPVTDTPIEPKDHPWPEGLNKALIQGALPLRGQPHLKKTVHLVLYGLYGIFPVIPSYIWLIYIYMAFLNHLCTSDVGGYEPPWTSDLWGVLQPLSGDLQGSNMGWFTIFRSATDLCGVDVRPFREYTNKIWTLFSYVVHPFQGPAIPRNWLQIEFTGNYENLIFQAQLV